MPSALVGSLSCARCSRILAAAERFCTRCGAPQVAAATGAATATGAGLLAGVLPASPTRRRTAGVVDVLATILPAGALLLALVGTDPAGAVGAGLGLAVVVVLAQLALLCRTGRTLGLAVTRLRRVDVLSALPPTVTTAVRGALAPWSPHATLTADVRRGRDPLTPAMPALHVQQLGPAVVPAAPAPAEGRRAARARHDGTPEDRRGGRRQPAPHADVRLVPVSGDPIVVRGTVLVGRRPEADGPDVTVHALPDMARTLSRNHAVLEWADDLLWVTDLHTTNGTTITSPEGAVQPLVPGQRTAAATGWRVELGEREYTVTAGGPA
ncbi:FHA domain-containing protein [Microbacterium sp. M1A1_1b]